MLTAMQEFRGKTYAVNNGTHYHKDTYEPVIRALESLRASREPCRIFYGTMTTGLATNHVEQVWEDEYDVSGHIGRSMGPAAIPLMIHSARSRGGPGLLDHCIVAIKTRGGWRYKAPGFDEALGTWTARAIDETGDLYAQGYRTEVLKNGEVIARFRGATSLTQADRYIAFMTGKRLTH